MSNKIEKKQTALDFLLSIIPDLGKDMIGWDNIFKAKEKERQQIIDADFAGVKRTVITINKMVATPYTLQDLALIESGEEKHEDGEQYYEQTYK